jgi:tetratricopeptide (TPR) repeat protein
LAIPADVAQLIAEGNTFEDGRMHDRAERAYLEAIAQLGAGYEELIGTISITLGSNAIDDGRPADAIAFYLQAIHYLDSLKGEALLQCAHAHYNLARAYLRTGQPDAVPYADEAVARYERYPFTSQVDLVDAQVLQLVTRAQFGHTVTSESVFGTWHAARELPSSSLNYQLAIDFLGILLPVVRAEHPDAYDATVSEISTWAGPEVAEELRSAVERHF